MVDISRSLDFKKKCKNLKCLVKMVVLTPVQHSQYGILVFIIPIKKGTARFITAHHNINQQLVRK